MYFYIYSAANIDKATKFVQPKSNTVWPEIVPKLKQRITIDISRIYPANLREKFEKVKKCKRKGLEMGVRFVNAFRKVSVMRRICCFSVVSETYLKVYPSISNFISPV